MRFHIPFTLRRLDVDDPEVWKRLPELAWYAEGREGAWPLRGPQPRDKFPPPPPPDNGQPPRRRARPS
jgi:hypothetical protein